MNIFKKTDFITVPVMEFVDYVGVIGPVEGVCLRPGKVRNHIVCEAPRKTVQYIDIIFWGYRKNVNAAKAKLLEFEYNRCNRFE